LSRRRAFVCVAFAFAVTMLGTTLPTPLYPIYREELDFSNLTITVIFALYAAGVIAALLLFGNLSDAIGRRRALLPGLALSAASAVVFLLADGLPLLFAGRILSGLSAGIFTGTATATLVDLAPAGETQRATLVATVVNIGGLGLGPLLAGVLAQYAADPLRLVFIVDLALLVPATIGIWLMAEPIEGAASRPLRIRPTRLGVPRSVRPIFITAVLAGFAGFAVLGLFTAVVPAFMGEVLDVSNHAAAGLVVLAAFGSSALGQIAGRGLSAARALPGGCALLIAGMALLVLGLQQESLAGLVAGGVLAGVGQGHSFAAGLAAVNAAAPADRRAATASSFFVVCYVAISIPVIGVGVAAEATDLVTAGTAFAVFVAVLAALAIAGILRRERGSSAPTPV
jgi:predicted MFS family arabinose efflux permease